MVAGTNEEMVQGFLNDATLNVGSFPVFAYSLHVYKASTYEYEQPS